MKAIMFNDSVVDTHLFMQLQDLSSVLSGLDGIEFEYNFGSFIDFEDHKITASHSWDNYQPEEVKAGYKTDIYLRALGTLKHSSIQGIKKYHEFLKQTSLPKFGAQLFTMFEDLRLEEIIKKDRPGTAALFDLRREIQKHYFSGQLSANVTRSYATDELYCLIFLMTHADTPNPSFPAANSKQLDVLEELKPILFNLFDSKSTTDIIDLCEGILYRLEERYSDSMNQYFLLPVNNLNHIGRNTTFDDLKRKDELVNCDIEEVKEEKSDVIDEKFSTWHRENKNEDRQQTFLQFELESGTKTQLMGQGVRESDEGDQAMASVQGTSGESKQKDYSNLDTLDDKKNNKGHSAPAPFGEDNKDAVRIDKFPKPSTSEDKTLYKTYANEIEPYKRKLANTIEKTLENKKTAPRRNLQMGRLSKNLLPLFLEEQPSVFYKKDHPSTQIDAVFTLLVDCSASMHNKMEETKKGIVLFHEVLKKLRIPHSIVGFWEDAYEVKEGYQPNYFHHITNHAQSLQSNVGPQIMQLEPQEDNRDGFTIRVLSKELERRSEKNKFLCVFSDGEPAAYQYDQNGIVDTHEAVLDARKKGIEVIGVFLSDGVIEEHSEKVMKNIYGKEHLLVPSVAELPEQFTPLLKKLLLKSI
jgi:nitric oxide reductase activation protein